MAATTQPAAGATGRDLDGGRLLAGLGALILLISLFLDWYGESEAFAPTSGENASDLGVSAWTSFELIDILLAALALATLVWVIEGIVRPGRTRIPSSLGNVAGPVALAVVLVSLISEPPWLSSLDPNREIGIWLALAGAALMTLGALLGMARISLVVSPRDGTSVDPPAAGDPAAPHPASPETETQPLTHEPGLPPPPR